MWTEKKLTYSIMSSVDQEFKTRRQNLMLSAGIETRTSKPRNTADERRQNALKRVSLSK